MSRETERRIDEIVRLGVISEVQHKAGLCRVSFGERVSPLSPWLMGRAGKDKEYWHPDIGEQAVFVSPYGDGSEGFVMVGIMSDKMPLPEFAQEDLYIKVYEDGTRFMVDRKNHVVDFRDSYGSYLRMADGDIVLKSARHIHLNSREAHIPEHLNYVLD